MSYMVESVSLALSHHTHEKEINISLKSEQAKGENKISKKKMQCGMISEPFTMIYTHVIMYHRYRIRHFGAVCDCQ